MSFSPSKAFKEDDLNHQINHIDFPNEHFALNWEFLCKRCVRNRYLITTEQKEEIVVKKLKFKLKIIEQKGKDYQKKIIFVI